MIEEGQIVESSFQEEKSLKKQKSSVDEVTNRPM